MDNLLIKSAKVAFPGTPYHDREVDVLLEKGIIAKIAARIKVDGDKVATFDAKGQCLAPGFFDMNVNPGRGRFVLVVS